MRLTVHVKDAQKQTAEVKTKDGVKKITRLMTTLSFSGVEEKDAASILSSIESNGQGTPVKHYWSNDRRLGVTKKKKA